MEGLLVRFYNGETTADESARIESWINQSADHRKIAEQVYYLCFASDALEARQQIDAEVALKRVRSRIWTER